jgi:hypothetical protein
MKSQSLNLLEPSGPHRACYRTPLPNCILIHTYHDPKWKNFVFWNSVNVINLCRNPVFKMQPSVLQRLIHLFAWYLVWRTCYWKKILASKIHWKVLWFQLFSKRPLSNQNKPPYICNKSPSAKQHPCFILTHVHNCGQGDQTTDHLLFHCKKTHTQREVLKQHIIIKGNWPAIKQELVSKYRNLFSAFIESIDLELLQ